MRYLSKRAKIEAVILLSSAAFYASANFAALTYHNNFGERKAAFTVIDRYEVNGVMYVQTNIRKYIIENSMLHWKWDATNSFHNLQEEHTYTATVVGIEVEYLGWYPRILSAKEIECPQK